MPKWTDYTIKTTVADNDEIMTLDTAGKANKRLSLSALSDWVLGKIADKVFAKLQTNNKTILGAINELNSKTLINSDSVSEYLFKLILDKNRFSTIIMYGSTSMDMPFLYLIFIDTLSNNRRTVITKILDKNSSRNFMAEYNDATQMLKITTSSAEKIWGGIRIIAII